MPPSQLRKRPPQPKPPIEVDADFFVDLWGTGRHRPSAKRKGVASRACAAVRRRLGSILAVAVAVILSQVGLSVLFAHQGEVTLVSSTGKPDLSAVPTDNADVNLSASGPSITAIDPTPVIFDTDIAHDPDDSLALSMLHGYSQLGLVDLKAVTLSYDDALAPAYVDAVNTFYGSPDTPLAAPLPGDEPGSAAANLFHRAIAIDQARFPHDTASNALLPTPIETMRATLADSEDDSVVVVSVGALTNLAHLLASGPDDHSPLDGTALVAAKVKYLSSMAGHLHSQVDPPLTEFNVTMDLGASQFVFDNWPTEIIATGYEIGSRIQLPMSALDELTDAEYSPVLQAARLFADRGLGVDYPYNQPTHDLVAVLVALEPHGEYLKLHEGGQITVDELAVTTYTSGNHGRHRRVEPPADSLAVAKILDRYVELIGSRPEFSG